MNSVLRRSLRLCNSSVLQRQFRPSTAFHQILPLHICSRAGWRQYSTHNSDGFKDRSAVGVFTPKAAALFTIAGAGLYLYFRSEKQRLQEQKQKELESRSVGRAHVGGPFEMVTHDGKPFTDKDLLGKWSLIYFGFTNCPDICPEELDKMSAAVTELEKTYGPIVQPIFISVDPARDALPQMARYVRDFHPRLIGLAGDVKAYRVYFSTPPGTKPGDDYLVDHSIFFYFMDPEESSTEADVVERVKREFEEWKAEKGRLV
ncbi:SCO1/SenC-domain-containing protein [Russula aff. rugulosa BPL654]|nr:SCO1/SenC-domain-containing protein [Russula aff. rugulosa BPL654]